LELMRLAKFVITALFAVFAMFAGLFVAVAVAVTGAAAVLLARLLRRSTAQRRPQVRGASEGGGDVIEVSATEVRGERLTR
jgi:hypothetical protein